MTASGAKLSRKCASCKDDEDEKPATVQRRAALGAGEGLAEAPVVVEQALGGGGRPLDAGTRAYFEPRFGFDLSKVRIHTDARAEESARAVNALAYTVGRDIVFAQGRYAPERGEGRRLLAHELAHVAQQRVPGARVTVARDTEDAAADSPAAADAKAAGAPDTGGGQAAQILDDALQRSDETAVLTVLAGRTLAELEIIKAAYQKRTTRSLDDDLQQKLSKAALSRARDLLRAPSPAMDLARQLSDAIKRTITDTDAITGALSGRTYEQWAEIQQAYREMTGQRELDADLRAAVSSSKWGEIQKLLPAVPAAPAPGAGPAGAAGAGTDVQARAAAARAQIEDALSGVRTDKEQLFAALTGRSKDELAEIAKPYGGLEALRDKLKAKLSDADFARVNELFGDTATAMAMRIHAELQSLRPSKDAVLAIAGGRAPSELTQMYEEYARLYKKALDTDMNKAFPGDAPVLQPLSRLEDPDFRARWEAEVRRILEGMQTLTKPKEQGGIGACKFPPVAATPDPKRWAPTSPGGTREGRAPVSPATDVTLQPKEERAEAAKPPEEAVGAKLSAAWTPKDADPYTAVTDLKKNLDQWQCDCAMFVEVVWLMAWHTLLPPEEFNKRFDGLKVRRTNTTGLAQEHHTEGGGDLDKRWNEAPPGTKVVWHNRSDAALGTDYEFEHGIKASVKAPASKDSEDTYYAHPMREILSEARMMLKVAKYSNDFPEEVFEVDEMRLAGFADQVERDVAPEQKRFEAAAPDRAKAKALSGVDPSKADEITKAAERRLRRDKEWVQSLVQELPRAMKAIQNLTGRFGAPDKSGPLQIWGQRSFFEKLALVSPLFRDALDVPAVKQALLVWLARPGTKEEKSRYVSTYVRRNELAIPL